MSFCETLLFKHQTSWGNMKFNVLVKDITICNVLTQQVRLSFFTEGEI
jgi:hypothetical protein